MIRQWKEFEIGPNDLSTDLHVTLSPKGDILIGAKAVEKLGNPLGVKLLFDEANGAIGLRPTNLLKGNAYPLKAKADPKHGYRVAHIGKFCRVHNIRVERRVKFTNPEIDDEGRLVRDLTKTITIGRSRK